MRPTGVAEVGRLRFFEPCLTCGTVLCILQATSFLLVAFLPSIIAKASSIEQIKDKKAFEKTIRTRTNVLVLFKKSPKDAPASLLQTLEKVADQLKGTALIAQVDCSSPDAQKVCKKEKADTGAYILRHYQKGEFHKVYDRPENLKTFLSFLKDPTAEAPWEDDPTSKDVLHIEDSKQLRSFLSSEKKPTLLMFYAPCKASRSINIVNQFVEVHLTQMISGRSFPTACRHGGR